MSFFSCLNQDEVLQVVSCDVVSGAFVTPKLQGEPKKAKTLLLMSLVDLLTQSEIVSLN